MVGLAKSARLVGVDNIHIGTAVGKLVSPKQEVLKLEREMETHEIEESFKQKILNQGWGKIKPVFAVSSGGLHPGIVPYVIKMLGNDCVMQLGGGIHGHPKGTKVGACAFRQAIDATLKNESLEIAAKRMENRELRDALEHFGHERPV
jgi:ribulose-bisphosphate carboxylase large chain